MSWLYSQALVEEYSEGSFSDGEPSVQSSGKHTQLVFSSADRMKEFSRRSLSGMTCKPLTASHGEDVLTSFLEAFPVRTLAAPEKGQASKESDLPCGRTWRESLEKFDLDTHTWKTHQCLWDEDLQPCSVILPKWGMMRSGVLWERTTLPPLTSGTASGSWPTPRAQEPGRTTEGYGRGLAELIEGKEQKQTWPTPRAREWKDSGDPVKLAKLIDDGHEATLGRVVAKSELAKNWPTPRCFMHKDAAYDRGKANLGEVVCGEEGATKETPVNGQLSPDWVEWLMGWPIGWTKLEPIGDLDWREWKTDPADDGEVPRVATGIKCRADRLKAIGNGQVPQVAALAWTILTK